MATFQFANKVYQFVNTVFTASSHTTTAVVLATGPGNPPEIRLLPGGSVQFSFRRGQKPNPVCLGGVVPRTGHRTVGYWPGWNRTVVGTTRFLHLWLQFSIWVLLVLWHGQYVDCVDLGALSPPAFRFAIRTIFVELLWKTAHFKRNLRVVDRDSTNIGQIAIRKWEVKERIKLHNLYIDRVMIRSELRYLIGAKLVKLKCRVFGGKTGPIATIRVFMW